MHGWDLFCGHKGWAKAVESRGHTCATLDIDPRFEPTVEADILEVTAADLIVEMGRPDFIMASCPCEGFSVGSIGKAWNHDHTPKNDTARLGLKILEATVAILEAVDPSFWIIENPDGKMKRMAVLAPYENRIVDYCQYGDIAQKRTGLWGGFPQSWKPRRRCRATGAPTVMHKGVLYRMDRVTKKPCHEKASRGDKSGTQGKADAAERAIVPMELGLEIVEAMEKDLGVFGSWRAGPHQESLLG